MKKFSLVLVMFTFVFLLAACKNIEEVVDDNTDEATEVNIGVLGPLDGAYAMYGEAVRDGALLAAKEINEAGGVLGKDINIIAYDTQGDVAMGVSAYNRLTDQDNIVALVGGTFSGVTLGIKDLAIADNLPVLTPTATNPDVTLNADNVFRACYTDSYQGYVAAVFMDETLNLQKVAVYYNRDDAYSEGLAVAFMAEFDSRGIAYDDFTFGKDDVDFSATITNIKNGGYDGVFLPSYTDKIGPILTEADDQGLTVPFVGGDGWDGIEAEYAAVAEGHYFANHYAKTDTTPVVANFVANYTTEYGVAPNALAALAYDAVYALAAALEDAGSLDAQDIIDALAVLNFTDAVTGSISFDANGDPIKAVTVIQIVNGQQTVAAKVGGAE